jgi:hypothetical protein
MNFNMFIRPYQPQDQQAFAQLNRRWVERYHMQSMQQLISQTNLSHDNG